MKTELTVLYGDVVAGKVATLEEFRQRLEAFRIARARPRL